ncbi:hypothetical protein HPB47_019199, partial [Ixodes persulcatus]
MSCQDREVVVEETGLHVHAEHPYIAVSSDHIVFEGDKRGLLEVQGQMEVVGAQWCDFVVWTNNGDLWKSLSEER